MESTNIKYSGKVTVKKYHSGKLIKVLHIKNSGTAALFNLICNFLAGSSSTSYTISPLLDVCSESTSGNFTSILNSLPRSSTPMVQEAITEDNNAILTYSFNLYNTNLASISGTGNAYFVLRNGDNTSSTVLAYVDTEIPLNSFRISSNEVWVISWDLMIGNGTLN